MAAHGPHVAVAAVWLVLVDLGLTVLGHARLQRVLKAVSPRSRREALPNSTAFARTVRAFAWVSARYPRSERCLAHAIALQRLLAWRGIAVDVRMGVRRVAGSIAGHAWVEMAGRPLAERADPHRTFSVLRAAQLEP